MLSNMKTRSIFFILTLVVAVTGCSTIISGKTQTVSFQSSPAGATVTISGAVIGVTPLTTMIEKKSNQTLTVSKEGYKTFTTQMTTSLDPWFWGNIVIGGLWGSTTDAATGAMNQYAPGQYIVTLESDGASKVSAATEKSKNDKAREFIILSYNQIMSDLSKGSGNYQNSLMTILEIPKAEENSALKRIKSLSESFPDIAQFAEQVAAAYSK